MFDLSLSKLALIGAVALVVVGPEKLPKVARMAGTLIGRAQRYLNEVKSEVSRDMAFDDLHSLQQDIQSAAQDIQSQLASDSYAAPELDTYSYTTKARNFRRHKNRLRSLGRSSRP